MDEDQIVHDVTAAADKVVYQYDLKLSKNETRGTPQGLLLYRNEYDEATRQLMERFRDIKRDAVKADAAHHPELGTDIQLMLEDRMQQFGEKNKPGL